MLSTTQPNAITETLVIQTSAAVVWQYLTVPALMKQWMLDTRMEMAIMTEWQVGGPILIQGHLHGIAFENYGTVLCYEPATLLAYTHLSSLSQLPGKLEDFCKLVFSLTAGVKATTLTLTITNFLITAIFKHLELYWRVALVGLKKQSEQYQIVLVNHTRK
jgi:uncharacterized protein YndB with AHSA1/START domain